MIHWWNETPLWQRLVILGVASTLFVLGMQSWVWSPINRSIAQVTHEVAALHQKNQESMKKIRSLKDVEEEVFLLREKLPLPLQQIPVRGRPQDFRKEVMDIGSRTGVSVRLWKPQDISVSAKQSEGALNIMVKVEGSFFDSVRFLDEVLKLSWVHTVNPMVLVRMPEAGNVSLVITDFTIKSMGPHRVAQPKDMQKI